MSEKELLASHFEGKRGHLRAVAYRMLGTVSEAEDAVQETWLRLNRSDVSAVENLGGWLTTVIGRVCLDLLRSRATRREESMGVHMPEPIISRLSGVGPEHEALLTDAVGLALLVVLDTLGPAERLAFVLHDMFNVSFDEIAEIAGTSSVAARQLASRARRRVQEAAPTPDPDLARQQEAVDAFLIAAHEGNFDALLAVLDPNVVLRADRGAGKKPLRGAREIASRAIMFSRRGYPITKVLVNGIVGTVTRAPDGQPVAVMGFTIANGKIVELDILTDPERLRALDLSALDADAAAI